MLTCCGSTCKSFRAVMASCKTLRIQTYGAYSPEDPPGNPTIDKSKHVAVAISGGVDSAVTAYLLKQQGHRVTGIFMQNWDEAEELGNSNCSVEQDLADAQAVCQKLGISLHTANFVREYWSDVFMPFVQQCGRGLTPNPDLLCNRVIKFDLLVNFAKQLGADVLATGHYARLQRCNDGTVQLLRAKDREKDQTYFLASVPGHAFQDTVFPLGHLLKSEVRDIAASVGLHNALRRSSAGICFIGRRKFADFLAQYCQPMPGRYVDVDSGKPLGNCGNIVALTHGQRAGLGGATDRMFVAGKDLQSRTVSLALGSEHPALYTSSALLRPANWIAGEAPILLLKGHGLPIHYKARYGQVPEPGVVSPWDSSQSFPRSRYSVLLAEDENLTDHNALQVAFGYAARSITPQQEFVMYNGEVCLGSAPIHHPGPTKFEVLQSDEASQAQDVPSEHT